MSEKENKSPSGSFNPNMQNALDDCYYGDDPGCPCIGCRAGVETLAEKFDREKWELEDRLGRDED